MKSREAAFAVCAFENAPGGFDFADYAFLRNSDLKFSARFIFVSNELMALPGQTVGQISEIHSHPMAFLQCQAFLDNHPHIQLVESSDTALSAKEISEFHIKSRAAIAGKRAAEVFGLDIIAADIHDNKRNFTRFLALRRLVKWKVPI